MMQEATHRALIKVVQDLNQITAQIRAETNEVVGTGDHVAVIKHFDKARLAVEEIKTAREALNEMVDTLSREQIPTLFNILKETTGQKPPFNIEGVGRVSVSYRFSASILDKERGHEWLRDNGHGGLIQPTVNASSLSSFAKDLLEVQGKELPEDIFKTGRMAYTSITKAK